MVRPAHPFAREARYTESMETDPLAAQDVVSVDLVMVVSRKTGEYLALYARKASA